MLFGPSDEKGLGLKMKKGSGLKKWVKRTTLIFHLLKEKKYFPSAFVLFSCLMVSSKFLQELPSN